MQFTKWYDKYTGFDYKHLGTVPKEGIDCFNLAKYIYEKELGIIIPYCSRNFCNILNENWYDLISTNPFLEVARRPESEWIEVDKPKVFDIIIMSIGATSKPNHSAIYVDKNRILQIMEDHKSYHTLYGNWYKQYTNAIFRWKENV